MSILGEFKAFISKGDVIDLAVAFVMGVAFNSVVTALVTDIVTPLIGVPGHVDFAALTYTVNGSTFLVGAFINAIIGFLAIAVAVFFFIIKPIDKMKSYNKKPDAAPVTKECPYCCSSIPIKAVKCAFCGSELRSNMETID